MLAALVSASIFQVRLHHQRPWTRPVHLHATGLVYRVLGLEVTFNQAGRPAPSGNGHPRGSDLTTSTAWSAGSWESHSVWWAEHEASCYPASCSVGDPQSTQPSVCLPAAAPLCPLRLLPVSCWGLGLHVSCWGSQNAHSLVLPVSSCKAAWDSRLSEVGIGRLEVPRVPNTLGRGLGTHPRHCLGLRTSTTSAHQASACIPRQSHLQPGTLHPRCRAQQSPVSLSAVSCRVTGPVAAPLWSLRRG